MTKIKQVKNMVVAVVLLSVMSACSNVGQENSIASLYTGNEAGNWYYFSNSCSAALCPPR